jgi:threonine dehydrogenase-like Zn-dependent dehydrogenase
VLSFRIEKGKLKAISSSVSKLRPGWALIRVRLVGICNTDVELLHGYYDFRVRKRKSGWDSAFAGKSIFPAGRSVGVPFAIFAGAD